MLPGYDNNLYVYGYIFLMYTHMHITDYKE